MMRVTFFAFAFVALAALGLTAFALEDGPPPAAALSQGGVGVVVMATERMRRDVVGSFFTSPSFVKDGEPKRNECELALADSLSKAHIAAGDGQVDKAGLDGVKAFRGVISRYRDMSAVPNFTAVKAASMVDKAAQAVVLCGVDVNFKAAQSGFNACAEARCKVVDMKTGKGFSAITDSKCSEGEERASSGAAAIRRACGDIAYALGDAINSRYEDIQAGGRR
jgi:hypothetical protein